MGDSYCWDLNLFMGHLSVSANGSSVGDFTFQYHSTGRLLVVFRVVPITIPQPPSALGPGVRPNTEEPVSLHSLVNVYSLENKKGVD